MANAKKCDRCGAYYTPSPEIPKLRVAYMDDIFTTKFRDLCYICGYELELFMDGCKVDILEEVDDERSEEMR